MENEATTKTPIPTRSGFRNFAVCTLIFAFSITRPSTVVETPLQISLFSGMVQFWVAASSAAWGWQNSQSGATIPKSFGFEAATRCETTNNVTRNLTYLNHACFLQNKANFKMGNINISTARTKTYAKDKDLCQRTRNNERHPKQTQSNPISCAQTPCSACRLQWSDHHAGGEEAFAKAASVRMHGRMPVPRKSGGVESKRGQKLRNCV